MAAVDAKLRMSGFKRILVRLDESTRRKYCCRALEDDLQRVKLQVQACAAAMDEAKQVEDATCKLHASQRAAVSSKMLLELESLQQQLETTTRKLVAQRGTLNGAKERLQVKEEAKAAETVMPMDAKTLARQILVTQEVDVAVTQMRQLEKVMPRMEDMDEKKAKWWKKHIVNVVAHFRELMPGVKEAKWPMKLQKAFKKIKAKYPDLTEYLPNQPEQTAAKPDVESTPTSVSALKHKKKRPLVQPANETAVASDTATSGQSKRVKSHDRSVDEKPEVVEKAQALLVRCSREVRTLRDKFELGAYDVNLSRMVTVVDSLWPNVEHSDVVSLTTALFTLVEIVEKVVNPTKRRDRLVCLESVLGVVLNSSKLQLTARRRTMAEEYANNCRQSLEQLTRQSDNREQSARQAVAHKTARTKAKTDSTWPQTHVRFG